MNRELERIGALVTTRLKRHNLKGRTITLKVKYSDFKQITRNQSLSFATDDQELIVNTAKQLLAAVDHEDKAIRLLGISLSNFGEIITIHGNSTQLSLFD